MPLYPSQYPEWVLQNRQMNQEALQNFIRMYMAQKQNELQQQNEQARIGNEQSRIGIEQQNANTSEGYRKDQSDYLRALKEFNLAKTENVKNPQTKEPSLLQQADALVADGLATSRGEAIQMIRKVGPYTPKPNPKQTKDPAKALRSWKTDQLLSNKRRAAIQESVWKQDLTLDPTAIAKMKRDFLESADADVENAFNQKLTDINGPSNTPQAPGGTPSNPPPPTQKDQYGYVVGEKRMGNDKKLHTYLGNDQWTK
jgi:hypothetical protein